MIIYIMVKRNIGNYFSTTAHISVGLEKKINCDVDVKTGSWKESSSKIYNFYSHGRANSIPEYVIKK